MIYEALQLSFPTTPTFAVRHLSLSFKSVKEAWDVYMEHGLLYPALLPV